MGISWDRIVPSGSRYQLQGWVTKNALHMDHLFTLSFALSPNERQYCNMNKPPPNTQNPKTAWLSCNFPQSRDDFLTVNRLINSTVIANRHSKLAKTAKKRQGIIDPLFFHFSFKEALIVFKINRMQNFSTWGKVPHQLSLKTFFFKYFQT